MTTIVPAILPASRKDLEEKLALATSFEGVHRVQIDIVDGLFATPATWPYASADVEGEARVFGQFPRASEVEYEVDLMTLDTMRAASMSLRLGARRLTLHAESLSDPVRTVRALRETHGSTESFELGLALNIASPLVLLEPVLHDIGYVQFMGIARIGVQGQPFERRVFSRIAELQKRHPKMSVQVDGGVSLANIRELLAAGVDSLVVGSAIFGAADPRKAVKKLQELI